MTLSQIVGAFRFLTRTRVSASGRYHYGSVETVPNDTLVGKTYCPISLLSRPFPAKSVSHGCHFPTPKMAHKSRLWRPLATWPLVDLQEQASEDTV